MPSSGLTKGIRYGWLTGETGWGQEMNDNLRLVNEGMVADWGWNPLASVGLTLAYKGGVSNFGGSLTVVADGSVVLAPSATNYVERAPNGTVSANTTGFSSTKIPMLKVTTDATSILLVQDMRSWIFPLGDGRADIRGADITGMVAFRQAPSIVRLPVASLLKFQKNDGSLDNLTIDDVSGNVVVRGLISAGAIDASALLVGTIPSGAFPATLPAVSGALLTTLNASNLANGTVPAARLGGAPQFSGLVVTTTTDPGGTEIIRFRGPFLVQDAQSCRWVDATRELHLQMGFSEGARLVMISNHALSLGVNNGIQFRIQADGTVFIGSDPGGTEQLRVGGDIRCEEIFAPISAHLGNTFVTNLFPVSDGAAALGSLAGGRFASAAFTGGIGCFGSNPPGAKGNVTGSRSGATATVLDTLLNILAGYGFLTNNTSA